MREIESGSEREKICTDDHNDENDTINSTQRRVGIHIVFRLCMLSFFPTKKGRQPSFSSSALFLKKGKE